jgi:heptosyltransferase-2
VEILVIQTAFPGDLYLSLPLLKQTRRFFPKAKIHLMCRQGLGETFLKEGLVDSLCEIKKGDASSYAKILKTLKPLGVDLVLCPHRSLRTALFLRRLRPKKSIGYRLWWNACFFEERLSYSKELPDALRQLKLLTLPCEDFRREWESFDFSKDLRGSKDLRVVDFSVMDFPEWMSASLRPWAPEGKVICVAPGSVWPTKRWQTASFSELTGRLLREGFQVKLIGSGADRPACEEVARAHPQVENLCGKTSLQELMELFQKARCLVSNDSGAMHVASAVGLPTVALFGPTVPEFGFRPWQKQVRLVQAPLECRPCSPHGTKKCPLGTHDCMKLISVEEVFRQVKELCEARLPYSSE